MNKQHNQFGGKNHSPIPFNRPFLGGKEHTYINEALKEGHLSGGGSFTKACESLLAQMSGSPTALLTHSCTGALELAAIVLGIGPGDEVIMPSYTFSSTANAFALRGATPIFVDVREDTLNLDESLLASAITPKTKAIVPVHYGGVACEMTEIMRIANEHNLFVIEDAAQGVCATYDGEALGGIGHMGALSFHATKNIISGEGGALIVTERSFAVPAEISREKGTDRSLFLRGEIDKYTWRALGSSYMPAEIVAAALKAQLESVEEITRERIEIWNRYHALLELYESAGQIRRPIIPEYCSHNAHLYYVILPSILNRTEVIRAMAGTAICTSHFEPLHLSSFGKKIHSGKSLPVTEAMAPCILRLPLWPGMSGDMQSRIIEKLMSVVKQAL